MPITDREALAAFQLCTRHEGIIPALESAHGLAQVLKLAPTMRKDQTIVLCLSGRGDKDVESVGRYLEKDPSPQGLDGSETACAATNAAAAPLRCLNRHAPTRIVSACGSSALADAPQLGHCPPEKTNTHKARRERHDVARIIVEFAELLGELISAASAEVQAWTSAKVADSRA